MRSTSNMSGPADPQDTPPRRTAVRLPDGELMPYSRWRRLREEHRDCYPECPVRRQFDESEQGNKAGGRKPMDPVGVGGAY